MMTAGGVTSRFELGGFRAERLDQRVVDDLDDHLARRDRAQHFLPDGLFGDLVDEIARDRERDVGLEQGDAHLAHRRAHVGLAERAAPAKPVEYAAEPIAQRVEHSNLLSDAERRYGTQNAKYAGGRNLVGRRAPVGAQHRCMSLETLAALSGPSAASSTCQTLAACPSACAAATATAWAARAARPGPSPLAGPRGAARRSAPVVGRWRSGTRSIGRDCCICWRGPTA